MYASLRDWLTLVSIGGSSERSQTADQASHLEVLDGLQDRETFVAGFDLPACQGIVLRIVLVNRILLNMVGFGVVCLDLLVSLDLVSGHLVDADDWLCIVMSKRT